MTWTFPILFGRPVADLGQDSVTLEEIDNVSAFVRNMDRLELPNQLVAVLADPLLQKLLMLRPEAESYQRVSNWLGAALRDLLDGEADSENIWEFMEVLRDFVVQSKVGYPRSGPDFDLSVCMPTG